ncbi:MAG: DNA mismatch repair protein MutS, partial [Thermoanaerobaculia bacterium]
MPGPPKLTPMLRHYLEVKAQYPDAILIYRMGDFFELFFEDAVLAAPILEVTLTARQRGTANEAPMCGVPHHALGQYLAKLLRAGLKVAICDQVEDPSKAKGLVKREVVRVVTPGTITDPLLLEGKSNRFLAGVAWNETDGAGAFLDVTTGDFFVRQWASSEALIRDMNLFDAAEIVFEESSLTEEILRWADQGQVSLTPRDFSQWFDTGRAGKVLEEHFGTATLRGFGIGDTKLVLKAAAAVLSYAKETQHSDLAHVLAISERVDTNSLVLDSTTLSNLEVFRNLRDKSEANTLLSVIDRTASPSGGRLLKDWLREPSRSKSVLEARYDAVTVLVDDTIRRNSIRQQLESIGDIERLLSRAVFKSLNPRDAAALREGLAGVPELLGLIVNSEAELLSNLASTDPCTELYLHLQETLIDHPPIARQSGGFITSGVNEELDRLHSLVTESKEHILALENREKESTGIRNLKVRFNRVFGYYIEISRARQDA